MHFRLSIVLMGMAVGTGCDERQEATNHIPLIVLPTPVPEKPVKATPPVDVADTVGEHAVLLRFQGDHVSDCFESTVVQAVEILAPVKRMSEAVALAAEVFYTRHITDKLGESLLPMFAEAAKLTKPPISQPWPPGDVFKKGELAFVDDCPNRLVLGSCLFGTPLTKGAVIVVHKHYDVASTIDGDAGMKTCIVEGGKWTSSSRDDEDVNMEVMRQHALVLRDLTRQ